MAYSTLAEIKLIIPENDILQLTDDEETGAIVESRVTEAIARADQIIDGYLRNSYTVPLAPVHALIADASAGIAVFNLYQRRQSGGVEQGVKDRRNNAIKILQEISKGRISLGVTGEDGPGAGAYQTNKTSDDKTFTETVLDTF